MRHFLGMLLLCGGGVATLWAQTPTPLYQTTFYFRDAVGHVDSIVVGFDPTATPDLDPDWDEVVMPEPWDSVFAVGAVSIFDDDSRPFFKKIIVNTSFIVPIGCYTTGRIEIFIHAIHQPVTVSWDRHFFDDERCLRSSLLANHFVDEVVVPYDWYDPNFPDNMFWCLAVQDSFTLETTAAAYDHVDAPMREQIEIAGQGMQTVYGLRLLIDRYPGWPCGALVADESPPAPEVTTLSLAPNPAGDELWVTWPVEGLAAAAVQVLAADGRQVWAAESLAQATQLRAPLAGLPSGVYWLVWRGVDGSRAVRSFVKQ